MTERVRRECEIEKYQKEKEKGRECEIEKYQKDKEKGRE